MSRQSVTGLIDQQHEVHRLENLFFKEVGSAYYLKEYGLELGFFHSPLVELPINSFLSHLTQEATKQGIVVVDIKSKVENFTLNLTVKLLTEDVVYLSGSLI